MHADGRRARGEASREALIAAALVVLERDGVPGVTQRAVAREAGLAANAVTYHFGTIEELFVSAIRAGTDAWAAALATTRRETFARDMALRLVEASGDQRARLVAELELYVLAARRPALRPAARRWADAMVAGLGDLSEARRRLVIAAIDGVSIQLLLADERPTVDEVEVIIEAALG